MNLYHVTKFPPYFPFTLYCFYTKISSFMPVLTIGIVRDCFYLLIFYSEKSSIWVWRLPFAVNVNLNLSIDHRGGADPGFFVRGGVTLRNYHFNYHSYGVYHTIPVNLFPCFTSTQIRHKDFFMQNTSCIWYWKGAGEWGGGGGGHSPHPPSRSTPGSYRPMKGNLD